MNMKQNLGKLARILRFALAFWWLGPWRPEFNPLWLNVIIVFVGWVALLESFIGWCWLHQALKISNKNQ